jgi:hypothetical protein
MTDNATDQILRVHEVGEASGPTMALGVPATRVPELLRPVAPESGDE